MNLGRKVLSAIYNQKNVFDFLTAVGDRLQDVRDLLKLLKLPDETISLEQTRFLQLRSSSIEPSDIEAKFSPILSDYPLSQMPFVILGQILGLCPEDSEPSTQTLGSHRLSGSLPKVPKTFATSSIWENFFRNYSGLRELISSDSFVPSDPIVFGHPLFKHLIVCFTFFLSFKAPFRIDIHDAHNQTAMRNLFCAVIVLNG